MVCESDSRDNELSPDERLVVSRIHERADSPDARYFGTVRVAHKDFVTLSVLLKRLGVYGDAAK